MPASEDLYVLAPGEGEDESEGWVSPRPIDEAVQTAVADATDLDAGDVDEAGSYADLDEVAALLDGDGEAESITFTVEGHEVTIDGGGHVTVEPAE
ncbi:HalOD1 output domain-containing protein [Halosimplex salinum]|uniref:HalOD1 output domain-containing protein n=1 Tax=Halosimplex salinum TaxID=1710538 RepID=UPI000F482CEF|nr:HalOD1 output domain-containing protein [Halosimplex salinum]